MSTMKYFNMKIVIKYLWVWSYFLILSYMNLSLKSVRSKSWNSISVKSNSHSYRIARLFQYPLVFFNFKNTVLTSCSPISIVLIITYWDLFFSFDEDLSKIQISHSFDGRRHLLHDCILCFSYDFDFWVHEYFDSIIFVIVKKKTIFEMTKLTISKTRFSVSWIKYVSSTPSVSHS